MPQKPDHTLILHYAHRNPSIISDINQIDEDSRRESYAGYCSLFLPYLDKTGTMYLGTMRIVLPDNFLEAIDHVPNTDGNNSKSYQIGLTVLADGTTPERMSIQGASIIRVLYANLGRIPYKTADDQKPLLGIDLKPELRRVGPKSQNQTIRVPRESDVAEIIKHPINVFVQNTTTLDVGVLTLRPQAR